MHYVFKEGMTECTTSDHTVNPSWPMAKYLNPNSVLGFNIWKYCVQDSLVGPYYISRCHFIKSMKKKAS